MCKSADDFYIRKSTDAADVVCRTDEYKEAQCRFICREKELYDSLSPHQIKLLVEMEDSWGEMGDFTLTAAYKAGFLEGYAIGVLGHEAGNRN